MKHLQTFEGMVIATHPPRFIDSMLSDGEILRSKMKAGTANTSTPQIIPYLQNQIHYDLFKNRVELKAYSYERLSKNNLQWSNYTWDDIELLEDDDADFRGIDKILHLVKNHQRHKGFRIKGVEYLFTDKIYQDFVKNAAKIAYDVVPYTPDYILLVETTSNLSLDIAKEVKKLSNNETQIIQNFFQKNPLDLIGVYDIIDNIKDASDLKDDIAKELKGLPKKTAKQKDIEREKIRKKLKASIKTFNNSYAGQFKSKVLPKDLGKFIWNLFSIDPDFRGIDISKMTDKKDLLIIDDVTSSSATTFKNIASIIGTLNVESATYFAAVSTSS